jgi:RNA polymerase sigma factor (sigma-70 family)
MDRDGHPIHASRLKYTPDQETLNHRVAVRTFLEESCKLAKLLPPHKKLLFLLKFSSGHTNREIAELCGVSEETVRRRVHKLAEELNEMRKNLRGNGHV